VDDLQSIVLQNLQNRQEAAAEAEQMILQGVSEFSQWLSLHGQLDVVRDYRDKGEAIRDELLAKAGKQIAAGQDPEKVLAELATKLSNRLMHAPTKALRQLLQDEQPQQQSLINTLLDL
jgi:glutamyl-tRNA reductase